MSPSPSSLPSSEKRQFVPRRAGDFALGLFLLSLGILFAASMVAYLTIRFTSDAAPALGTMKLSPLLFLSTAVIVLSSFTAHQAVAAVRRERQEPMRLMLVATLALSLLFLAVQVPALWDLVQQHAAAVAQAKLVETPGPVAGMVVEQRVYNPLFMAIFFLVVLHAAHVLGGILPLVAVTIKAFRGRYDHEHYAPIQHVVRYWHFLDIVWIVMFSSLMLAG